MAWMMQKRGKSPGQEKRSRASREEWAWAANLPTSFRETGDLHPEHGTPGTRNRRAILGTRKVLLASRTTSKLHCQSLAFEVTAMESRDNVTSIHGILILDEAKAVHQLDLRNLTGAMGREVFFDILFGDIAGKIPEIESGG
jgi:hypothetical protein